MRELIAQAVEMGYTFFDNAEVYGTPENPHDNEESGCSVKRQEELQKGQ